MDDAEAIRRLDGMKIVAPRSQLGGFGSSGSVMRNGQSRAFSVMGDYPEVFQIQPVKLLEGRYLNRARPRREAQGGDDRPPGGRGFLRQGRSRRLGKSIRINGIEFQVIGTFDSLQTGERGNTETENLFVPFTTYQQAFNGGGEVGWFSVNARDGYSASLLLEKTLAMLRERHQVAPDDTRAFGSSTLAEQFGKMSGLLDRHQPPDVGGRHRHLDRRGDLGCRTS